METIQVVLDSKLRQIADRLAQRKKVTRSAIMREALREYAKRERIREMEVREQTGYEAVPETEDDWQFWEREAVWPER